MYAMGLFVAACSSQPDTRENAHFCWTGFPRVLTTLCRDTDCMLREEMCSVCALAEAAATSSLAPMDGTADCEGVTAGGPSRFELKLSECTSARS